MNLLITERSDLFFNKAATYLYSVMLSEKINNKGVKFFVVAGCVTAECVTLILSKVTGIAESIIVGLGNIFGAAFSSKCSLLRGVKQLFTETGNRIALLALNILLTPFLIVGGPVSVVFTERFLKVNQSDRKKVLESIEKEMRQKDLEWNRD